MHAGLNVCVCLSVGCDVRHFFNANNRLILSILANVYINFLSKLFCMNLGPVLVLTPLGYIMHYLFITIFYCKHRVKY